MENLKNIFKNKKNVVTLGIVFLFLIVSFVIYKVAVAASGDNEITVASAKFTSIKTGNGNFDASDGLDYGSNGEAYSVIEGYTRGTDSNENNRIVRSFDSITYNFDFSLKAKNGNNDYDSREVSIIVELTDEEAKYVTFTKDMLPGENSYTYKFDGIDTYGPFQKEVTLYVLGAPNGMQINPKFTIKESTDQNAGTVLGKVSNEVTNYSFENDNYETTSDFKNYLPTVVSSEDGRILVDIKPDSAESQKATYNSKRGRYITYVAGIYIEGNSSKGIKGKTMPEGNITFNAAFTGTGEEELVTKTEWNRLYSVEKLGDIEGVVVNLPYSTNSSNKKQKEVYNAGNMTTALNDNVYNVTIKDYKIRYEFASLNADDSQITKDRGYIGTYQFTIFQARSSSDAKQDLTSNLSITNLKATSVSGAEYTTNDASRTLINSYYESSDYSFNTKFLTEDKKQVLSSGEQYNVGSLSKGSSFVYETKFNYKETGANEGLKEVIKINNNAFRVMPISDEDEVSINIKCGKEDCKNINKDNFEVKFISGTFASSNYSLREVDSRIQSEFVQSLNASCQNLNLSSYSSDQILNLYGGPCLKANENVESEFASLYDAKDNEGKEIPITKVVVQTKNGVVLPNSAVVTVDVKLRVRNVKDLTRTYQAAAVATTSDYDEVLRYYSPNEEVMTDPNNYVLASIKGQNTHKESNALYATSLRIANFTAKQDITVLNKNKDGSMKTNFNAVDNETIRFNVKTYLEDYNEVVGADDTWYIKNVSVTVVKPAEMEYIKDTDLDKYLVYEYENVRRYELPFTKTNMTIPDITFKAKLDPKLSGAGKSLILSSSADALNVNGEKDNSMFGTVYSQLEIFATGINNVIVEQKLGAQGSIVEKDTEFSYKLRAYNNTGEDVTDYKIVDVLPSSNDYLGSKFEGTYKVKLKMPESLAGTTVYCLNEEYAKIKNEIENSNNNWTECNLTEDYVENITAIKIDNISINKDAYTDYIELIIKPTGNKYSNTYFNSFIGGSSKLSTITSNTLSVEVVSRTISGNVFIDSNENGIKEADDVHLNKVPVTLYKLDSDNKSTKLLETTTDKDGNYTFKDLDVGRYYIDIVYDSSLYDLTRRYATENQDIDSDAYVISDKGIARISNKRIPNDPYGIRLTRTDIKIKNMDAGLIPRKSFSFDMKKYITRIDLSYNGSLTTTNYNNATKASITVRNSLKASAKVYYGISITNDSTKAGYVKEIQEDIPEGLIFDPSYNENAGWIEVNGTLKYVGLSDTLIKPGETRYLQIVLFMNEREKAGTFVNTVSIVSMEAYEPEELAKDNDETPSSKYELGEAVTYAGVNWHVLKAENISAEEQKITLMADPGQIALMGHNNDPYKWSTSDLNAYLNMWAEHLTSLDLSSLYDNNICDDASGLPVASYGGSITGRCQSQIFTTSKIRLITVEEVNELLEGEEANIGFLTNSNYWTQSSDWVEAQYTEFGVQTNSVSGKALAIINGIPTEKATTQELEIRPVITISSKKILFE